VLHPSHLAKYVAQVAGALHPHWTLVPSDDPGLIMLGSASAATPGRVVYLAHTLQQLPLGPRAFYPSATGTRLLKAAAGVLAVSHAARDYLWRWGKIDSALIRPQIYGSPPFPRHGDTGDGAVTMVNPCGYKGLPIFLALADARPGMRFHAVPTWGTTRADLESLRRRPNITIVDPSDDIDEILSRTRVLVMPSLWDETFGYTSVEAMLRGIPVLAADVGGLSEAKLGVPYLLPVRRITRYEANAKSAARARPVPMVPEQDPVRWQAALDLLLTEPSHYAEISGWSRAAAADFVASLDDQALEQYLSDLLPVDQPSPRTGRVSAAAALTPERRAALAGLLAARAAARQASPSTGRPAAPTTEGSARK
jgi:hypothetical protein